jgi:osmoprotectant transport system substrate-binding protein
MNRSRRSVVGVAALCAVAVVSLTGCGSDDSTSSSKSNSTSNSAKVVIGIQDFGESKVLAEVYGQALTAKGFAVSYKSLGGYRDLVYTAFSAGDISFTPEYAASALEFLNSQKGEASSDAAATVAKLSTALKSQDLVALDAAPAVDTNAIVVTADTATRLKLSKLSDLTDSIRLGGPQDCTTNAYCIPGIKRVYGVDLSSGFQPLDGGGPLTKAALKGGSIDAGIIFSTDSSILANKWKVLEDDRHLFAADNIVPVLTSKLAADGGSTLRDTVNKVSAAITTEKLLEMNNKFENDKLDAADVAKAFLSKAGITK